MGADDVPAHAAFLGFIDLYFARRGRGDAMAKSFDSRPAQYWHKLDDGRIQCDLCPRFCRLHEGQRAFCFVRARQDDQMVLTTYGRSSGFCVDPVEKKPLSHFLPGSPVLSFGTSGCNLARQLPVASMC